MKICLITDSENPLQGEELLFLEALKVDSFFDVDVQAWDDATISWESYDAVIIRSAWSYAKVVEKFLEWTRKVAALGVEVINSPELIKWNSNKNYLLDLAAAGIPILPTIVVDQASLSTFSLPVSNTGWIVKPTVGGSAIGVRKFNANSEDLLRNYVVQMIDSNKEVLIQPFAKEIMNGEVSFVFFGDQYSHACKKTPDRNDFRVQPEYGGHDRYFDATDSQISQARAVIKAAPYEVMYARVDMIEIEGRFVLMEFEAIEPYLFFGYNQAPKVFIDVLKNHLDVTA